MSLNRDREHKRNLQNIDYEILQQEDQDNINWDIVKAKCYKLIGLYIRCHELRLIGLKEKLFMVENLCEFFKNKHKC